MDTKLFVHLWQMETTGLWVICSVTFASYKILEISNHVLLELMHKRSLPLTLCFNALLQVAPFGELDFVTKTFFVI